MSFIRTYTRPSVFASAVIGSLLAGAALGALARATEAGWLTELLDQIGSVFTTLLQIAVIPLVFTAIIVGINSLRGLGGGRTAARLGGKTVLWFATTSLIAVLIGIVVGLVFNPGSGGIGDAAATAANTERAAESVESWGSWTAFIEGIVPSNAIAAFAEGQTLQVLFLALVIGAAAYSLGDKAKPFIDVTTSLFEIIQRYLGWIVRLAPIGILGLIGAAVANYGDALFRPLLSTTIAVYVGSLLVLFVVYPVLLRFVAGVRPSTFFAKSWTAIQFAFVSQSSAATLPLTRQTVVNLGVSPGYAAFATPLASATKMDGCAAVFPAIGTIFIANISGVSLNLAQYLGIVLVAVFGALATAGTTGWLTALTLTTTVIGLDSAQVALGIALIYSVNPIMDMMRTATNVAGQIAVPTVVARSEGLIDDEVLAAPSAPPLLNEEKKEAVA
ncbi:sodium:proton antiporter [Prauserella marina]|uniref:Na+/H+-dicarboxylate symporter n=1 Tax=Prauserella marina TaxID=530584 RepID=A0A222VJZ0_9PSEU|nr:dicarboxylate/amino acid:cation symporter [Prauserella marina]ASR34246.1 sodium:proton antiporter [Prauserella marina]PWV71988.1 Na+/H+-dicarboxylate symporter [Prauserella marina]SDD92644.1 Na+/H+-dicarboxylate symporter [Prauserella marina]